MQIDVYSDMVCPWCRIGRKNMQDAIDAWSKHTGEKVEVRHHAFQLDPSLPPEGLPFMEAMSRKMGGEERFRPMLDRVTEAGAAVGVTFRFDRVTRMPSTELSHRITALLPEGLQEAWIDAVMKANFEDGQDIAKQEVLLGIAREIGADVEELSRRLDAGEGADAVRADMDRASGIGISGVPFFILNNKYALSGAYPAEQFLNAFRKISQEEGSA